MLDLLFLIFGDSIFRPYSFFIKKILELRGISVGKNFRIHGKCKLILNGNPKNILIQDNVFIRGNIDIRNRENGKIIFEDNVYIDTDCRFVAAREATILLKNSCEIGLNCLINAGADVSIGQKTMVAGYCFFQSSNHGTKPNIPIKEQTHTYGPIHVGNDVWVGSYVGLLPNSIVGDGAIIGAQSLVTGDIKPNSIAIGTPAKVIKTR